MGWTPPNGKNLFEKGRLWRSKGGVVERTASVPFTKFINILFHA